MTEQPLALAAVMDEIAAVLKTATGLAQFHGYPPATVSGPAGYVSYPQTVTYTGAYQRGECEYTALPVTVLVGKPTQKSTRDRIAAYCDVSGPSSIPRILEEHRWQSCDDLTCGTGSFDVETVAGVDYLAVTFLCTVIGPGKD